MAKTISVHRRMGLFRSIDRSIELLAFAVHWWPWEPLFLFASVYLSFTVFFMFSFVLSSSRSSSVCTYPAIERSTVGCIDRTFASLVASLGHGMSFSSESLLLPELLRKLERKSQANCTLIKIKTGC